LRRLSSAEALSVEFAALTAGAMLTVDSGRVSVTGTANGGMGNTAWQLGHETVFPANSGVFLTFNLHCGQAGIATIDC
jgi:hypothetical protein